MWGTLLHAAWNALVKSSGDKQLDIALVHFLGAVVALPLLATIGLPPARSAPFLAGSLCIHVAYYHHAPTAPTSTATWARPTRSCAAVRR